MRQRRGLKPALITAIAGGICLALATPASAANVTIPLKNDHKNVKAADFKQECTGPFAELPEGKDGWHFVLPGGKTQYGDFVSLTLTFKDEAQTKTVKVPEDGPDWGFLRNAGDQVKHAYVFTPAGWTLADGSAEITGGTEEFPVFNLSHTCAGKPSDEPSPSPSGEPTPSGEPSETPGEGPSETPGEEPSSTPPGDEGGLPLTGAAAGAIALTGVALVGGGAALMVMRRRRDNITFTS
ncbi:MAG TPA: LPXTG cell wall anchor domain-containing protein [Micromonosporaceae bacterium]|nr:LPXTG cell wall anchor domain-containing protein [Micromonosporaceae bacterium]